MTQSSFFGHYVRQSNDHMEADFPVDTLRAFLAMNNAHHLLDVFSQTHVNFSMAGTTFPPPATASSAGVFIHSATSDRTWSQEFQLMWFPIYAASLYVMVQFGTANADEVTCTVRCVPAHTPVNDLTVPSLFTATATTSATSETIEQFYEPADYDADALAYAQATTLQPRAVYGVDVDEDGEFRRVVMPLMRLEVTLSGIETLDSGDRVYAHVIVLRESA